MWYIHTADECAKKKAINNKAIKISTIELCRNAVESQNLMLSERGYAQIHCMIYLCAILEKAKVHGERKEIRGCWGGGGERALTAKGHA